jgi:hypothetical protein
MLVNGMGHDIPCGYSASIAERITDFISGKTRQ